MSDIEKIRSALSWAANWLGMKFTPRHQEALEALGRLAARVGEGWQPIESVPKDAAVDLWVRYLDFGSREIECTWDVSGEFWRDREGSRIIMPATHWRLLPLLPETNDE